MTATTTTKIADCPSCNVHGPFEIVFRADRIPVNSCILIESVTAAADYPRGDLLLGVCQACGVATNLLFDTGLVDYRPGYEVSQIHSPTFGGYARRLAAEWFERYNLGGKHVVEIGCGSGEFLSLFLELGAGRATGFDPACAPSDAGGLRLIDREFSAADGQLGGDFIFCRHTLEHLHDTGRLLDQIHGYLGPDSGVPVCFEVPDFQRILDECAFWDIYYEHCSYFTADSLARLFRRHGFEALDVRLTYADQYLVIDARQAAVRASATAPVATDGLSALRESAHRFAVQCAAMLDTWSGRIADWRRAGRTIVLWGSGSKAVGFLTGLGCDAEIAAVVDINPAKQGVYMPGCRPQIIAPRDLVTIKPDVILIMNPIYTEEIRDDLTRLGLAPELVPLEMEGMPAHA